MRYKARVWIASSMRESLGWSTLSLPPMSRTYPIIMDQALLLANQSERCNWVWTPIKSGTERTVDLTASRPTLFPVEWPGDFIHLRSCSLRTPPFWTPSISCLHLNTWTTLCCLAITANASQLLPTQPKNSFYMEASSNSFWLCIHDLNRITMNKSYFCIS